jgi:hypothetical protein
MGKDAKELPFVDGTHPVYRAANNGDVNAVKRRAASRVTCYLLHVP